MKIEKVEIFVASLHNKKEYFIHIRNEKQALNNRLLLKTGLKNAKNDFEKYFFELISNVQKHRYIKLVTIEREKGLFGIRNKQISYKKIFSENLLAIKMKKHKYS